MASQLGCFDPALQQIVINRQLDRPNGAALCGGLCDVSRDAAREASDEICALPPGIARAGISARRKEVMWIIEPAIKFLDRFPQPVEADWRIELNAYRLPARRKWSSRRYRIDPAWKIEPSCATFARVCRSSFWIFLRRRRWEGLSDIPCSSGGLLLCRLSSRRLRRAATRGLAKLSTQADGVLEAGDGGVHSHPCACRTCRLRCPAAA